LHFFRARLYFGNKGETMKNIQFTSRETDYNFLIPLALLASFGAAGVFLGLLMPTHGQIHEAPWILAAISVGVALFVWSVFRLIEPAHYNRGWKIAEVTLVPLYWLVLVLAAYVCLGWLIEHSIQQMQDIVFNTIRR
jgi:hypothetical protein